MDDKKDQSLKEYIKPTEPNVPEKTRREMAKFFMRTSVPRILAERKKEMESNKEKD